MTKVSFERTGFRPQTNMRCEKRGYHKLDRVFWKQEDLRSRGPAERSDAFRFSTTRATQGDPKWMSNNLDVAYG